MDDIIKYKSEVETVPKTGSTNNLTTETDIDAISVFFFGGGASFSLVFTPTSPDASFTDIPRWRTDTGSSYNFATENDIMVI